MSGEKRRRRVPLWLSIPLWILGSLVVVIGGGIAILVVWVSDVPLAETLGDAAEERWNRIGPTDDPVAFVRPGNDNLMVFFSGGGANWDAYTTDHPITIPVLIGSALGGEQGYWFDAVPFFKPNILGGILSGTEDAGEFADWTVLYIPYTTGDFHVGTNTVDYGDGIVAEHHGSDRVRSALDWIQQNKPTADRVMVAGESAGGFGAAFWLSDVAERYPEAPLVQYSDGAFLPSDRWPQIFDEEWGAAPEERFGVTITDDPAGDAIRVNAERYGDRLTTLVSQTRRDSILPWFTGQLNGGDGSSWERLMPPAMASLADVPRVSVFIADAEGEGETPHTMAADGRFVAETADGVALREWVTSALDDVPPSLGVEGAE